MNKFYMSNNQITVVVDNKSYTVVRGKNNFDNLVAELSKDEESIDWNLVKHLADVKTTVLNYAGDNLVIIDNMFYYKKDNVVISTSPILDRIVASSFSGEDVTKYLNFFDKILSNPSDSSREELFIFLESCNLPITSDGDFLAYKVVRNTYFDWHSNSCDNSIGKFVEMPRDQVDSNRTSTCSFGLHFCSKDYIQHFCDGNSKLVVLKINPKDVVSIPDDYNNTKGRCCKYQVIGEVNMINIPELKDIDYEDMIKKLAPNKTKKPVADNDIVHFTGSQKEFFAKYAEPRNTHTTYILRNNNGETAYKFIGGLGQRCFKKVDMPEHAHMLEFTTKTLAMKQKLAEGTHVRIDGKVYVMTRVKCSDGYRRLKLVEE